MQDETPATAAPSALESFHLVQRATELDPLLAIVEAADSVALDTEADSMHHYREKLCLVQIGVAGEQWIVDPLSDFDIKPLLNLLEQRPLILHGADYDLRLLHRFHDFRPTQVFDTMLAAQLLGIRQFGLMHLVLRYIGVTLDKECQKADWSERPLSAELLTYASGDTRYLHEIARRMRAELVERGRLEWHQESCARQIAVACAPRGERDHEAWRIRGGRHLRGRAAAVLRELWHWREEIAERMDRPPFKVAGNELLLKYALWVDENPRGVYGDSPEPPPWLRGSRLRSFQDALAYGLALMPGKWPGAPTPPRSGPRLTRHEEAILTRVVEQRDARAGELELDPGVLGPRDALRQIVRDRPESAGEIAASGTLMHWQAGALADAVLPLLSAAGEDPEAGADDEGEDPGSHDAGNGRRHAARS